MWTHNFFLILSMFGGNGADAATEDKALPPMIVPTAQPVALSTMVRTDSPDYTKPLAKPARIAKRKMSPSKVKPATSASAAVAAKPSVIEAVLALAPSQPLVARPLAAGPQLQVAVAPDAGAAIQKVQSFYNSTKSFTAVFTQTVTNQTFNKLKPKVSKGKVYILKPGKMRWDYKNKSYKKVGDPKVSKSFISDGTHLWAVMHKNKQYYKEELGGSTLPVAVSFLMGKGDLRKEFNVAFDTAGKFGSKSDILLVLTPKRPSARYKKLWLIVDASTHAVKQSVVLNSKGDTNSIRFSRTKVNDDKLKNGHFIFNAKANKDFRLVTPPKPAKKP
jgi:outer membrane lipoprotein carrier protein